jgi:hypothetical protein
MSPIYATYFKHSSSSSSTVKIKLMPDTRAIISVMALDKAKQAGFKLKPMTMTLTSTSGQAMKVDGMVTVFAKVPMTGRS